MTEYSTGIRSLYLNIEFELQCVVGLPGYFARTFSDYYICLGSPIVVDSSFVLYLLTLLMFTSALAGAERQSLIFECAIRILDFASDVQSPTEPLTTSPNPCQCNTATLRNGGTDYKVDVHCSRLCVLLGKRVYTIPDILGIYCTLSGFSVELIVEDLETWIKAYEEDKGHIAVYSKLLYTV